MIVNIVQTESSIRVRIIGEYKFLVEFRENVSHINFREKFRLLGILIFAHRI
jgi:hypothetical protein